MILTPEEAASVPCPVARTFADKTVAHCRGEACVLWRWEPLSAEDPRFKKAIKDAVSTGTAHKAAVAWVMENRLTLGLPTKPERGFCGIGGRPVA